jgi:hypothetical protein
VAVAAVAVDVGGEVRRATVGAALGFSSEEVGLVVVTREVGLFLTGGVGLVFF